MLENEEEWAALVDSFQAAALGVGTWEDALRGIARATGSRSMQMTGISSGSTVLFNLVPDIGPAVDEMFARSIPFNPRVAAVERAPVLKVIADCDITTPDAYHKSRFYREVTRPLDVPYTCLANLEKSEKAFVGLAALRSHRDGHITGPQREVFARLVPYLRAAIRMQLALEQQGAEVATRMMGALSVAAFLCDTLGNVRYATAAGDEILSRHPGLRMTNGSLGTAQTNDGTALSEAIDAASRATDGRGPPVLKTVVIASHDPGVAPLVLDVFALRARQAFELWSFAPRILVVARGPRGTEPQKRAILRMVYGLTPAECAIALRLTAGQDVEVIATERACTVGTVRQQVKGILIKTGVSKQLELTALVSQL